MLKRNQGFTLVETLVSAAVMVLFVLLVLRLLNSARTITALGGKRMDTDAQARPVLNRMALDFAQMVKRKDVTYYVKTAATVMPGNDLIGFYSAVQGYYPTTPSPLSVVAYRVNSDSTNSAAYNRLERMGKGLDWNGASTSNVPVVFLPFTIDSIWPSVASSSAYDDTNPNFTTYEVIGPQVFRFEYCYLLTDGTFSSGNAWSSNAAVDGMRNAAAIVVAIAVIDPKSRLLLSDTQLNAVMGRLVDAPSTPQPGDLLHTWQAALDGITDMPRVAVAGVRLYERYCYLSPTCP